MRRELERKWKTFWKKNNNDLKVKEFFLRFIKDENKKKELLRKILVKKSLRSVMQPITELGCSIGEYSYCGKTCYAPCSKTTIGKFCSISENVCIGAGNHPTNYLSTSPFFYLDYLGWCKEIKYQHVIPCHIGNDVWIGRNVFIKDGVSVGDGAIIGAGAIVVKDIPPYAIVGGVPAKIIRYRFDQKTIDELLNLEWWNFDIDIIKKAPFEDIEKAIEFFKKFL